MKGKLTPLDTFLPFIIELHNLNLVQGILIIVFDSEFGKIIDESPFYKQITTKYNIIILYPTFSNLKIYRLFLKLVLLLRLVVYFPFFMLKKNIVIFGLSDISSSIFSKYYIRNILKVFKFDNIKLRISPQYGNLVKIITKSNNKKEDKITIKDENSLITSFENPTIIFSNGRSKKFQIRKTGKIRSYQSWTNLVRDYSKSFDMCTKKNLITFWPLSVLIRYNDGLKLDIASTIEEILVYLAKQKNQPYIIFKFHPTTDRNDFFKILKKSQFKNYDISYEHASVLISKSNIVLSTMGSSLFNESWLYGVPNVLYLSKILTKGKTNNYFLDDVYKSVSQFIIRDDLYKLNKILNTKKENLSFILPNLKKDHLKKNILSF